MITYKNEYINLVVLGSFNPAILTHEFLVKNCEFDFKKEPKANMPPVPVISSLEYEKVSFFADLGRIQITEKDCAEPKSSQLPHYLDVYLKKLPYTPITKCGANFSYELTIENEKLKTVEEWLKSHRSKFNEILKSNTIKIEISLTVENGEEKFESWTIRTKVKEYNASTMMKISSVEGHNDKVKVDFNYEVGNLNRDKNLIKSITGDYAKAVDLFLHQVERIFG